MAWHGAVQGRDTPLRKVASVRVGAAVRVIPNEVTRRGEEEIGGMTGPVSRRHGIEEIMTTSPEHPVFHVKHFVKH